MRPSWLPLLSLLLIASIAQADEPVKKSGAKGNAQDDAGWISIFDGKTLDGWKAADHPETWTVKNGMLVGDGERSHLFYMQAEYTDLEFKADVRLSHGGDSGMYFRAEFGPGWPRGYEAQVNNTSSDPKRTGSLYNFVNVARQWVPDNTWCNQHIIARGNHIVIQINGKTVVDTIESKNTYTKGYVALQQHNKGSVVEYKNLLVRPLPASDEKPPDKKNATKPAAKDEQK
jgi:hypothetical protein